MDWIHLAPGGAHSKESSGSIEYCLLRVCEHCWLLKKKKNPLRAEENWAVKDLYLVNS
jgi:hypothetical protein